ncbi:MAG: penicillin-binding protein 1C, partial [Flavisolibacter sp.]
AEITALSIIPNRPSSLIIGKNNDIIIKERNRWLEKFEKEGIFTRKEIEYAMSEPLSAKRMSLPHFIPHLAYKLAAQSKQSIIRSSIVLNTQLKLEKLTEDYIHSLLFKNIHNAAVIVVDNKTHKVISYIGSAGFKDTLDGGQVNGAAAVRQPGSTLKPLLYGLCIDEGYLTPKVIINDVPINYSGYTPENYDQKFNGPVTVEYALEHSLNIPAVKSLKGLGKDKLINKLIACDFKQIRKDQKKLGLSLILGGCGTTLEELTGLFSALANNGLYIPLQYDESSNNLKSIRLLSPASSYMITEMLSKVNRPDFPLNWTATEHMPKISWKTGTSYGRRDAWSIGYNKNYTVGIWVGNFSGTGVPELSGANVATPLLFKIFNTIDYDNNGDWYSPPENCALRQVCAETGLPPGPDCTNLITDYFIPLSSSTITCQHLKEIKVSADESISYCSYCAPATGYKKKIYHILEPELQDYYMQKGISFQKIPPHNPNCEKIFKGDGPVITFPVNGSDYYIDSNDPEPLQLTAHAAQDVNRLYWYINDEFYKSTGIGEKQFFIPKEGPVKISCTDDKGRNRNIFIRVRYARL